MTKVCVIVVNGVHGPIIRKATTKSAWGKLSLADRFDRASGVYVRNPSVMCYVTEGVFEDCDYIVKRSTASQGLSIPLQKTFDELCDLYKLEDVLLVSTLSSAVFLRESNFKVQRIVRNVFFEDASMSLPGRMDSSEFRDVLCEMVGQLTTCLSGDRVFNKECDNETLHNLQLKVKSFVGGVEEKSKPTIEIFPQTGVSFDEAFQNGISSPRDACCPCGASTQIGLSHTIECYNYLCSRFSEDDGGADDSLWPVWCDVLHDDNARPVDLVMNCVVPFDHNKQYHDVLRRYKRKCVDVQPQMFSFLNPLNHVNQAADAVVECAEACQNAVDFVQDDYMQLRDGVLNILKEFFPGMITFGVSFLVEVTQLFIDFVFAVIEQSWRQVVSCAVRVCCMLKIPGAAVSALVSFLGKNQGFPQYGREGEVHAQAGTPNLIVAIAALLGTLILQCFPTIWDIGKVVNNLRLYSLMVPAINNFSSLFEVLPKLLPDCLNSWLVMICPAMGVMKIANDEFFDWLHEAKDLTERRNFDSILQSTEAQLKVIDIRQQGMRLLEHAAVTPEISGKLYGTLSKVSLELDKLQHNLDIMAMAGSYREVPFCINITGVAGVGKSFITSAFAQLMAPPDWPESHLMYGRNCKDENWDGYYGQFAVVCDDFGQFVEGKDFEELINMVNNEQFRPRFASMDDPSIGIKGTLFSSKLVVLSSNSPYPPCTNDVRHPVAVERRRHMVWECALRPGFEKWDGTLDETRLSPLQAKQFAHLVWRRLSPVQSTSGSDVISNWYSSREMFMISLGDYRAHRVRQRAAVERKRENDWIQEMREDDVYYDFDELNVAGAIPVVAQGGFSNMISQGCDVVGTRVVSFRDQVLAELTSARMAWLTSHVHVNHLFSGLQFVASAFGVFTAIKGFSTYFKKDTVEVVQQSWQEPRARKMRRGKLPVVSQMANYLVDYRPVDIAGRELVDEAIIPSTVYLQLSTGIVEGTKVRMNAMTAFAVCGDVLIVPWHFFFDCEGNMIESGQDMFLDTHSWLASHEKPHLPRYHFKFSRENIQPLLTKKGKNRDVALYKCCLAASGGVVRPFRNRLDLVVKEADLADFAVERAAIVSMKGGKQGTYFPGHLSATTEDHRYYLDPLKVVDGVPLPQMKEMRIQKGWQYDAVTTTGDCGAPIVVLNKNFTRKVCGIHVATVDGNIGIGELITQEQIRAALNNFQIVVENLPHSTPNMTLDVPVHVQPQGSFDIFGTLDEKDRTRLADKTSLRKTFLFEIFGDHQKEPAVLHPSDPRCTVEGSPLIRAIEKYGEPCKPFDWAILNEIAEDFVRVFKDDRLGPLMILTEAQAINGIHGLEFFDSLNMASSPGFPFRSRIGKGESKRALFGGEEGELFVVDSLLRARLDLREEKARIGARVPSAFVDCLKDEKVSLAKVALGKTRTFACAPLDFVMLLRRVCLAFVARVQVSRKHGFSAIGTNCESLEWNDMVEYLLEMSNVGFAGDFSKFDGTLSSDCIAMVCEVINQVYDDGEENARIRAVLFNEIIHTVHHAMDCMYVCSGGNPSGNPMTAVLNTLVNETYLRYSWYHLVPEEWRTMAAYHANVRSKIYGDDNWVAVNGRAVNYFNMQTVSVFLRTMGIVYLPPSKVEDNVTLVAPLLDWDFLKRKACIVPEIYSNRYVAQLDIDTIHEMLYWMHDTIPEEEAVEQTAMAALYFAFGHGHAKFTEIRSLIMDGYRRARRIVPPTLPTWRYLLTRYRNGGFPDVAVSPSGAISWLNDLKGDTVSSVSMLKKTAIGISSKELTFLDFCKPVVDEDGLSILPMLCVKQGSVRWVIPQSDSVEVDSNKFGITLTEQTSPIEQDATRGNMVATETIAQRSMQDMDWNLKAMVERFNYVTTIGWNVGTPGVIYHAQVPQNLLQTDTVITPFTRFMFWRGQVEIRIQLNGTRFHMGRLIAYFVPLSSDAFATSSHVLNRAAQTSVQHMFLDPSVSSIVTLKIPFVNYKSYLNIGNGDASLIDYLGQFYIQDFTSLVAVSGASTRLNVTAFVSFPNSEFKVPSDLSVTTSADALLRIAQRKFDHANLLREHPRRKKRAVVDVVPQGNSVSNRVTNIFQAAADVTMPIEAVGDKFDIKSNVSGLDKVNVPMQPQYLVLKPFGYTNHCANLEFLNRLALKPNSLNLVEPEHFGTDKDEMEFSYIFTLPTYMDNCTWNTGQVPNTIIYDGLLGPCCMQGNRATNAYTASVSSITTTPLQWQPTMLDYATLPFSFWRGGLRLKFDIVCTAFHVGRLWFGVHFGDYTVGGPAGIGQAFSSYGAAIDIGPECHTFIYDVPFLSTTQYKRVIHGRQGGDDTDLFNFVLGTWSLRVLNPLTVTNGVANAVTINIFASGADDYEIAGLHMNNVSWVPVQAQGAQDLVEMPTMSQSSIGKPMGTQVPRPVAATQFGERYYSVREVCRRYCMVKNELAQAVYATPGADSKVCVGFSVRVQPATNMVRGTFGHFARMFRVWRGSLRFKALWSFASMGFDRVTIGQSFPVKWWPSVLLDTQVDNSDEVTIYDAGSLTFTQASHVNDYTALGIGVRPAYQLGLPFVDQGMGWPMDANEDALSVQPAWRAPPMDIGSPNVPYQEFEMPFCTIFNVLQTNLELTALRAAANDDYLTTPGILWFGLNTNQNYNLTTGSEPHFQMWMAAGDDFRLGLLLGPATVQLQFLVATPPGTSTGGFTFDTY